MLAVRINITGRHMELTDAIREYTEKKTAKLSKYYNRISDLQVVIDAEGVTHTVEIIIKADHARRFIVCESDEDLYACIDTSIDKIERQLTRHKEKSRIRKGRTGTAEAAKNALEAQKEGGS